MISLYRKKRKRRIKPALPQKIPVWVRFGSRKKFGEKRHQKSCKNPLKYNDFSGFLVRVAGFEPTASWTRISHRISNRHFCAHIAVLGRGEDAVCSDELSCLRPLRSTFGSRFGSKVMTQKKGAQRIQAAQAGLLFPVHKLPW